MKFKVGDKVKHVKSGKIYTITDIPEVSMMKATGMGWISCYIYCSSKYTFVRSDKEMEDGRFELIESTEEPADETKPGD